MYKTLISVLTLLFLSGAAIAAEPLQISEIRYADISEETRRWMDGTFDNDYLHIGHEKEDVIFLSMKSQGKEIHLRTNYNPLKTPGLDADVALVKYAFQHMYGLRLTRGMVNDVEDIESVELKKLPPHIYERFRVFIIDRHNTKPYIVHYDFVIEKNMAYFIVQYITSASFIGKIPLGDMGETKLKAWVGGIKSLYPNYKILP